MKNGESPAVVAFENDFDAFFAYVSGQGQSPQKGGMGEAPMLTLSRATGPVHGAQRIQRAGATTGRGIGSPSGVLCGRTHTALFAGTVGELTLPCSRPDRLGAGVVVLEVQL